MFDVQLTDHAIKRFRERSSQSEADVLAVLDMKEEIFTGKTGIMADIACYMDHIFIKSDIYSVVFVIIHGQGRNYTCVTCISDKQFIADDVDNVLDDFHDMEFRKVYQRHRETLLHSPLAVSMRHRINKKYRSKHNKKKAHRRRDR